MAKRTHDGLPAAKKKPTVALFSLDDESNSTLRDCFGQFNIDVLAGSDVALLRKEKLEGCVVSLTSPTAETIVAAARDSAWQKRMVIYGVGPVNSMLSLTKYGINVLLDAPVARQAAVKAIHSTRLLLLNELRRYVRLPLATPVMVEHGSRRINATSVEVSAGGMSLHAADSCPPTDAAVSASFAVPDSAQIQIAGIVCWSDPRAKQFGVRFDPAAEARAPVQAWIETYLGID